MNKKSQDEKIQEDYYSQTAAQYDSLHLGSADPEHEIALHVMLGLCRRYQFSSFLDVGAGTGRTLIRLLEEFPNAEIHGIEPVEQLREIAYSKGISPLILSDGNGTNLAFPDNSYDLVTAFGILHHIRHPNDCIIEMLRVAKSAIFISDLNNFGCGGLLQRFLSQSLRKLGLWKAFQFLKTNGKMYKISEGDGLFYSYSVFDSLSMIHENCSKVFLLNTAGLGGFPYKNCSHVALLGIKNSPVVTN